MADFILVASSGRHFNSTNVWRYCIWLLTCIFKSYIDSCECVVEAAIAMSSLLASMMYRNYGLWRGPPEGFGLQAGAEARLHARLEHSHLVQYHQHASRYHRYMLASSLTHVASLHKMLFLYLILRVMQCL